MIVAVAYWSFAVGFIGGMITEYLIAREQFRRKAQK